MLRTLLLLAFASLGDALAFATPAMRVAPMAAARTPPALMQFGRKKKTVEEVLEEKGYWPGEWVCADCGYIYEPGTEPAFEELRPKWKCPQCAGPRRRFVKKAGGHGLIFGKEILYMHMNIYIYIYIYVYIYISSYI